MAIRVMLREMRAQLADPRGMLVTFAAPFLFRMFLPGFNGGAFPALLIVYVVLGLVSTRGDGAGVKMGLTQFPVTARDHVAGVFLYQAAAVLAAGALALMDVALEGPGAFAQGVVPKALGVGLLLVGALGLASLWLPPQAARIFSMLVTILMLNALILGGLQGPAFLPWLSVPASAAAGLGGWGLALLLGLRFPPRI